MKFPMHKPQMWFGQLERDIRILETEKGKWISSSEVVKVDEQESYKTVAMFSFKYWKINYNNSTTYAW